MQCRNAGADAFGNILGCADGQRQGHCELVAPQSLGMAAGRQSIQYDLCDATQEIVATNMTKGVVDVLEAVHIDQ